VGLILKKGESKEMSRGHETRTCNSEVDGKKWKGKEREKRKKLRRVDATK